MNDGNVKMWGDRADQMDARIVALSIHPTKLSIAIFNYIANKFNGHAKNLKSS